MSEITVKSRIKQAKMPMFCVRCIVSLPKVQNSIDFSFSGKVVTHILSENSTWAGNKVTTTTRYQDEEREVENQFPICDHCYQIEEKKRILSRKHQLLTTPILVAGFFAGYLLQNPFPFGGGRFAFGEIIIRIIIVACIGLIPWGIAYMILNHRFSPDKGISAIKFHVNHSEIGEALRDDEVIISFLNPKYAKLFVEMNQDIITS